MYNAGIARNITYTLCPKFVQHDVNIETNPDSVSCWNLKLVKNTSKADAFRDPIGSG